MLSTDFRLKNGAPGGIAWIRMLVPGRALVKAGHEVLLTPHFAVHERTGEIAGRTLAGEFHDGFDMVISQRMMRDHHVDVVKKAQSYGQVVLSDIDDWYWGLDQRNPAFVGTHVKNDDHLNRQHYKRLLSACDGLIASTEYLAGRLENLNDNIFVCRNNIDYDRFPYPKKHEGKPAIGWVGSTTWRMGDLETMRGLLGSFMERHDLEFRHFGHMSGAAMASDLAGVDPARTKVALARHIHDYPDFFEHFDVGIVPLSDIPFNYAKSCLKGLEYVASGIPFVAADTPEYRWLESQGIGMVARNPRQWKRYLTMLLDPDTRNELAKIYRKRLEAITNWDAWLDVVDYYDSARHDRSTA